MNNKNQHYHQLRSFWKTQVLKKTTNNEIEELKLQIEKGKIKEKELKLKLYLTLWKGAIQININEKISSELALKNIRLNQLEEENVELKEQIKSSTNEDQIALIKRLHDVEQQLDQLRKLHSTLQTEINHIKSKENTHTTQKSLKRKNTSESLQSEQKLPHSLDPIAVLSIPLSPTFDEIIQTTTPHKKQKVSIFDKLTTPDKKAVTEDNHLPHVFVAETQEMSPVIGISKKPMHKIKSYKKKKPSPELTVTTDSLELF